MTGILLKSGNLDTDIHMGRTCEYKCRYQGDVFTNQGTSRIASKLSEASADMWNRFSLAALMRNQS